MRQEQPQMINKITQLAVRIPMEACLIGQHLIGKPLLRYSNFFNPEPIGMITNVDVERLCIYAIVTDETTINEVLTGHNVMSMEVVKPEDINYAN